MSEYAQDLAALLVEELYGNLTGCIYRTLLRRGRSTIQALQPITRLSQRQIKHGLAVLTHQWLVFCHTPAPGEAAIYEAKVSPHYDILRAGKYLDVVKDRFGDLAGEIVSNIMLQGLVRVGDVVKPHNADGNIISREASVVKKVSAGKPWGEPVNRDHPSSESLDARGTLETLMECRVVEIANESDLWTPEDIEAELDKLVPKVDKYKASTNREKERRRDLDKKKILNMWIHNGTVEQTNTGLPTANLKRNRDEQAEEGSRKKTKLNHNLSKVENPMKAGGFLHDDLVLRINPNKFAVMMRNDFLVDLSQRIICERTSKIYSHVLRALEHKSKSCKSRSDEQFDSDFAAEWSVSTTDVASAFKDSAEIHQAIGNVQSDEVESDHPDHRKKRRRKDSDGSPDNMRNGINGIPSNADLIFDEDPDILVSGTGSSTEAVRQHLLLLAEHPHGFLQRIPSTHRSPERWSVNYNQLMSKIVSQSLFHTISSRYGAPSARLARICDDKGRLDDKTLCNLSLLTQKELRARLLMLQKAGLLEQQELPRDNARVASRTTFMYYFDKERCSLKVVEDCQKIMLRCLQRLRLERGKVANVLEKVERTDVRGREDELLGEMEKNALRKWRDLEEKLLAEVGRIDELVCVLRDYAEA